MPVCNSYSSLFRFFSCKKLPNTVRKQKNAFEPSESRGFRIISRNTAAPEANHILKFTNHYFPCSLILPIPHSSIVGNLFSGKICKNCKCDFSFNSINMSVTQINNFSKIASNKRFFCSASKKFTFSNHFLTHYYF